MSITYSSLRRALTLMVLLFTVLRADISAASEADAWAALRDGAIGLMRHANAPGVGDPRAMRLGDCATQRNLDEAGRAQARRIGERFRSEGVRVGQVLTSQWCRATDTADIAFPGLARPEPVFNSFFDDRSIGPEQSQAAKTILAGWAGPGALVIATHQVNITGLTGLMPASGEIIVVRVTAGTLSVVGRLKP